MNTPGMSKCRAHVELHPSTAADDAVCTCHRLYVYTCVITHSSSDAATTTFIRPFFSADIHCAIARSPRIWRSRLRSGRSPSSVAAAGSKVAPLDVSLETPLAASLGWLVGARFLCVLFSPLPPSAATPRSAKLPTAPVARVQTL